MARRPPLDPVATRAAKKKRDPFPFVLDELAPLEPRTRPMFGCLAVYVGERIVFILREKTPPDEDNGVWVACEPEQLKSLLLALPRLSRIEAFGDSVSGWKKLSARSPEFEEDVLAACALVLRGDARMGKVPVARKPRKKAKRR